MSDVTTQVADAAPPPTATAEPTTPFAAFDQLWAVAILMHIAGNPIFRKDGAEEIALGVTTAVLGAAALWLLVRPGNTTTRTVVAVGTILSLWFEAPVTGNHWLLAALISVALLISRFRPDPFAWFSGAARPMLLAFYSFAAFAKLNSGFFDPVESCARFYANQTLDGVALPDIDGRGISLLIAVAVAAIELSVPVLLFFKRSRFVGVMVGFTFHFLVSLDLNQHFYDFSSLLFALFALFLADEALTRFGHLRFTARNEALVLGVGGAMVVLVVVAGSESFNAVRVLTFIPWLVYGIAMVRRVLRLRGDGLPGPLRPRAPVAIALVVLVVANGLTPYLEIKTATSWNMYANLVTNDGESNHYVIPSTVDLLDRAPELVEVVASDDNGLRDYIGSGYLVPLDNLRAYLADNEDAMVTVIRDGAEVTLSGEDGRKPNLVVDKFFSFRSVDVDDAPGCQNLFFVAR